MNMIPPFIRKAGDAWAYREDHRGIPLLILCWMGTARLAGVLLIEVLTMIPAILIPSLVLICSSLTVAEYLVSIYIRILPKHDLFTPLGFHLFRWTIKRNVSA